MCGINEFCVRGKIMKRLRYVKRIKKTRYDISTMIDVGIQNCNIFVLFKI